MYFEELLHLKNYWSLKSKEYLEVRVPSTIATNKR